MKRLYAAAALCIGLLVLELAVMLPASHAKVDVVNGLLQLPAPPPPNPLAHKPPRQTYVQRTDRKPPGDDAPIDELLGFWGDQTRPLRNLSYVPEASDKTLDRIFSEIDKDPSSLPRYLAGFPENDKTADFVKGIYDREGSTGALTKDAQEAVKEWLTFHSRYFLDDLSRGAQSAGDTDTYVSNQEELLQLTKYDFDRAEPMIDKLYSNGIEKVSHVLATWALYRHAQLTDSADVDHYRDELKSVVENKSDPGPMRDLAMDALVSEKEWTGRDDWYASLLGDETLSDLKGYTGLTTIINVSPPGKYADKMIELVNSDNKVIRSNAIRNLTLMISPDRPEVIKALLPWLEDPNWATDINGTRDALVRALATVRIPESVPGLIAALDEKQKQPWVYAAGAGNMAANRATLAVNAERVMVNAMAAASNRPLPNYNSAGDNVETDVYPLRYSAIAALGYQGDIAAVPALRRILPQMEPYERRLVVGAMIQCNAFTTGELVDGVEAAAGRPPASDADANLLSNVTLTRGIAVQRLDPATYVPPASRRGVPPTAAEMKAMVGELVIQGAGVTDQLVSAVASRIEQLDTQNPPLAAALRGVILHWPGNAVDTLFLKDLKNDKADVQATVRLLSRRRTLREQMTNAVFDVRGGTPTAIGIAACLIEDVHDYDAILAGDNPVTKTALLACSRLIRAPLPVDKVASLLTGGDKRLTTAAELYLESEDSPAARAIVLARHPGEAKIMGARTAFFTDQSSASGGPFEGMLFASVQPDFDPATYAATQPVINIDGEESYPRGDPDEESPNHILSTEKTLRDEIKRSDTLVGIYSYDGNYVRMYKDRTVFSWDEDESRYRERDLTGEEFEYLKAYLTQQRVDELAPFLQCDYGDCPSKELLMLGKDGGRRVYMNGDPATFFVGLDKYFASLKTSPATVKYTLSRDIPGLELLLADDQLHVETVWKNGSDLRVAVSDKLVRAQVANEIDRRVQEADDAAKNAPATNGSAIDATSTDELRIRLEAKRAYEGYSWRHVANGAAASAAEQPPTFEVIPHNDILGVEPTNDQWKARTAALEIRASSDGLFKVVNGRMTKLQSGFFEDPVVTPNGKWVLAYHQSSEDDAGSTLYRINLLTNKMFPVPNESSLGYSPLAYISSVNRILVLQVSEGEGEEASDRPDDAVPIDPDPEEMMLVDPETGAIQPAPGEFRPLSQQTFRPLQPTSKPNEFWAAMPDAEKNETQIGVFDTNHFGFRSVLTVPKIKFNSMSMWVDEAGGKIYFVYRGQLLSLPLGKQVPPR